MKLTSASSFFFSFLGLLGALAFFSPLNGARSFEKRPAGLLGLGDSGAGSAGAGSVASAAGASVAYIMST